MKNPIVAITTLYNETMAEMRKCSWPGKNELGESTVLVVSSLILLSLVVTVTDKVLLLLVRLITGV